MKLRIVTAGFATEDIHVGDCVVAEVDEETGEVYFRGVVAGEIGQVDMNKML